ncbi:TonB-dependent receptor [Pedobacter nutrimenti]|uniref:TonB-dependent receptor n=1 Tax=Pedobacter nutrimenti TaxID=1241337 RepID=UPI00292EC70D|nr:TonB-dependent receptor [Pedobacter nutrimenti]
MKKIQLLLAVLLYTLFTTAAFAVELTQFQGKVIDADTKQPLPGAMITIPDLRVSAVTNESGAFILKNIPAHGHFLIQIRYVGYQTITQTIDFGNAGATEFRLKPSVIEGKEVVITGSANSSDNKKNSTTISSVSKADLLYHPSTNLIDAISRTPGVSQITTGPGISKPVIRGLSYNRVVTLSDGVKQQGQQWGDEHGIEIDQYSADRVEVLKGPASLMYGSDALGGVINILDALPAPEGTLKGEFLSNYATNNGLTGSSLMLQGNENGFVYRARGSYKNAYSYKTPTEYVPNSGYNETNFEGQIGLNKKWGYAHLDASSFRTNIGFYDPVRNDAGQLVDEDGNPFTDAQNKDRALAYPKQDVRHYKIALNSNLLLGDGSLKATLGYQHNLRRELGAPNEGPSLFLNSYTYSYDLKYSFKEFNGWAPVAGISGEFMHSINTTGLEQLVPDFDSQAFGGFVFIKKTWDNDTFNAGARFDYRKMTGKEFHSDETDFNAFTNKFSHVTGALGYTHEFNDAFSFKANAGSAFRAPNIAELSSNGVHEGVFRYEVGNPNLKPEQSFQFDASFDYENQYLNASLGGFANYINNYIYYNTNGQTKTVEGREYPVYDFVQDNAFLRGIEASLTLHPVHYIHFDNSFSYTRATNRTTKGSLPFIPAATLRNELRFEPNIAGTSHSYISVGIDNFFKQTKIDSFETPTSGYTLLNASVGTTLKLSKNQEITLYVAGKNLLDKAYYDHLSRFKPGRLSDEDPTLGIYNQGRNITFGVNIPFTLKK